jgi:high mobility group protein B1
MSRTNKTETTIIEAIIAHVIQVLNRCPSKQGLIGREDTIRHFQNIENKESLLQAIKSLLPKKCLYKREKKLKDESAPKKAKTSYMIFCEEKRSQVKDENPEMKMIDITITLGKKWRELSDDAKGRYVKKAGKDKKRFEEENKDYVRPSDKDLMFQEVNKGHRSRKVSSEKKSRKKQEGAPKNAISSYIFFSIEKRAEVKQEFPDMKPSDITKELGRRWKDEFPSDENRKKWIGMAEQDKKRAQIEKELWDAEKKGGVFLETPILDEDDVPVVEDDEEEVPTKARVSAKTKKQKSKIIPELTETETDEE